MKGAEQDCVPPLRALLNGSHRTRAESEQLESYGQEETYVSCRMLWKKRYVKTHAHVAGAVTNIYVEARFVDKMPTKSGRHVLYRRSRKLRIYLQSTKRISKIGFNHSQGSRFSFQYINRSFPRVDSLNII